MKSILQDVRNQTGSVWTTESRKAEGSRSPLQSEELEAVIAPKLGANHNETFLSPSVVLDAEELEAVIAPGIRLPNHNETFFSRSVALDAEELEAVIAPKLGANHNETFLSPSVVLDAEELETVIAPGMRLTNHNETFLSPNATRGRLCGR